MSADYTHERQKQAATLASHTGWYIRICKSKTEAHTIKFSVGIGGHDESHTPWFDWHREGAPEIDEYDFPASFIDQGEVWIRAEPYEEGQNAHVCLCYQSHVVKEMKIDNGNEQEKHQGDSDSCEC